VFNRFAASTPSPATCEPAVCPALVGRFSDIGGLSEDTRVENEGKVNVGRPAVVVVLEVLEDAF
jgi:hypothetical protein